MLTIALCDDEGAQRVQTAALLEDWINERPALSARVSVFSSAAALLAQVDAGGGFDVYILDIIMPEQNGIELGLSLRRSGSEGALLYLSSSPDYALESYQTRAANYLLKPVDRAALFDALDKAAAEHTLRRQAGVTVRTREASVRLPFDDLCCAELVRRAVRYHLRSGEYYDSVTIIGSFQEAVSPLLADSRFALCGASFAVNLHFVRSVGRTELTLVSGRVLPLPRAVASTVKKQWVQYWLAGGE